MEYVLVCNAADLRDVFKTGYQIEKRKPGGSWEKANDSPIFGENATVSNLDEGQEYEFRVAALTDAGVGDQSLNSIPVKVCDKKG